jgi:hypothetical protein
MSGRNHIVVSIPSPHLNTRGSLANNRSFSFARGFAMPFTERAIDPNNLEFMRAAFNKACERLGLQCRREDRITDVVVDTIIEIAATGERDPDRVCELVLLHLKEPQRDVAETVRSAVDEAGSPR